MNERFGEKPPIDATEEVAPEIDKTEKEREVAIGEIDYTSPEQLKTDVSEFMVSSGLVENMSDIEGNFLFRKFAIANSERVLETGTDRTRMSETHYEGKAELLKQELKPQDIMYTRRYETFAFKDMNTSNIRGGLSIYDANLMIKVRNIPHAHKMIEGHTFKEALVAVITINNAPGEKKI